MAGDTPGEHSFYIIIFSGDDLWLNCKIILTMQHGLMAAPNVD